MTWTPGPWTRSGMFGTLVKAGDRTICDCLEGGVTSADDIISAANARLITAAPQLYEALFEMCQQFTPGNSDQLIAIAFARGVLDAARGD